MSRETNYTSLIPQELLTEIFTRLPTRSLGRCKCVSKPWASLISDPNFIQAHLAKTKNATSLAVISTKTNPGILYSVHFYNNNVNCDGFVSKLNFSFCNTWYKVWGSYDGLLLVEDACKNMFLINPTTLKSKKLPSMPRGNRINCLEVFGFGYDSSCDDYVVVALCYESGFGKTFCAYVYMLKTNHWNHIMFPCDHVNVGIGAPGIFVGGSLHWIARNFSNNHPNSCLISAFNIANKEFSQVPLPNRVFDSITKCPTIGVLKGCLCLITDVYNRNELWMMKEYGVIESWIKLSVFLTYDSRVVPLDLQEDGLVMLEGGRFVLLVSNAKEVTLQDMKVIGLPHHFRVGMTFVDTLVSP